MAYTEFYCQNGGSNLNAGSTTNNTAAYTSTAGNWVQATGVFTPTDSSNPSSTVAAGDWASVYVTAGATVATFIGRVTSVQNATNGTITVSTTVFAGSNPSNGTGTMTLRAGGAWQGPNAAVGFPFTLTSFGNNQDASSHICRVNMKNDQTYSLTAAFSANTSGARYVVQGYTSSVGDGGKSIWDGGTSTGSIISAAGPAGVTFIDHIFTTSITSGASDLITAGSQSSNWIRCVFAGSRGFGLAIGSTTGTQVFECEAYNNNRNNSSAGGGFSTSGYCAFQRCVSHDNTGSNTSGFKIGGGTVILYACVADTNGQHGISLTGSSVNGPIMIDNCDIYNNTGNGINVISGNVNAVWIENTNLVKNGGAGINNASTTQWGLIYNCGYGAGTQANGSADTLNGFSQTGTVTYASNVTPWTDPANGDFRINLATAINAGRGAFTQTQGYSSPNTVGYPDIGAAQHLESGSSGSSQKAYTFGA